MTATAAGSVRTNYRLFTHSAIPSWRSEKAR
jgi:hypothetical protein